MDFIYFLDNIKLPFELPLLIHPITVHFAIAIPIVILLLEIFNLFVKRPSIDRFTTTFLFLLILIYVAAFFAGKADGSHAFSLLGKEGQEELKVHKTLGMFLVYLTVIVFLVKVVSLFVKKNWMMGIYIFLLIGFIGLALKQGKDGGELVYEYGANVEMVSKMDDKIMELEDELDECKTKLEEATKKEEVKEESKTIEEKVPQEKSIEQKEQNATKPLTVESPAETNSSKTQTEQNETPATQKENEHQESMHWLIGGFPPIKTLLKPFWKLHKVL